MRFAKPRRDLYRHNMTLPRDYIKLLGKRSKKNRIYTPHQAIGAEIAEILNDTKHIGLYIKLAKEHDKTMLMALARDVASRNNVRKKGAYFTRVLHKRLKENGGAFK